MNRLRLALTVALNGARTGWFYENAKHGAPGHRLYDGFDRHSRTLTGPQWMSGVCLLEPHEIGGQAWADTALPPLDGAAHVWRDEGAAPGQQLLAKWLLRVDGADWLATRYCAFRRPDFLRYFGRIVGERLRTDDRYPAAVREALARSAGEAARLRADPPRSAHMLVFERDVTDLEEIRRLIRAHVQQ